VTTGAIKGNEDGFSVDDSAHAAARPYGYCSQERRRDAVQRPTTLCLVAIFTKICVLSLFLRDYMIT